MKEIKTISFFFPPDHFSRKDIILLFQDRNILKPQRIIRLRRCHHRLHGNLVKAQIRKMQDIRREIRIPSCIGSADVILKSQLPPLFRELLKFLQDDIVASGPFAERPHPVVDFFAPVYRQNHIVHLPVAELHYLIVKEDTVGGQCKAEFLRICLFKLPAIGYQLLYDFPVHKGFAAEKIHFQMSSRSGIGHKKVQGFFSGLVTHQSTSSVILTLFREAVAAGQVAVMRHMQAQGFHNSRSFRKYFY